MQNKRIIPTIDDYNSDIDRIMSGTEDLSVEDDEWYVRRRNQNDEIIKKLETKQLLVFTPEELKTFVRYVIDMYNMDHWQKIDDVIHDCIKEIVEKND